MRPSGLFAGFLLLTSLAIAGEPTRILGKFTVRHAAPPTQLSPDQPDIIVCEFKSESEGTFVPEQATGLRQPQYKVVTEAVTQYAYSGLNTDAPKTRGNMGEADLLIIKRTETEIEMVERTGAGNVVMHSLFLPDKSAVVTKQYRMPGAGVPFAFMQLGKCW